MFHQIYKVPLYHLKHVIILNLKHGKFRVPTRVQVQEQSSSNKFQARYIENLQGLNILKFDKLAVSNDNLA